MVSNSNNSDESRGGAGDHNHNHFSASPQSNASGYTSDDEVSDDTVTTTIPYQQEQQREIPVQSGIAQQLLHQTNNISSSSSSSSTDNELYYRQYLIKYQDLLENGSHDRMVLDPKYTNHNDYGSIHSTEPDSHPASLTTSQRNSTHALLNSRTNRSDYEDDEEATNSNTAKKMTQGDLYQRQPLLPTPVKSEKWGHHPITTPNGYYDEVDDEEHDEAIRSAILSTSSSNGMIKISMPPPVREEPKFPKEKWKTFIALLVMMVNFVLTTVSLALVHERVPDRDKYGPLPDKFLDTVPALDWALDVSEYLIMIAVNSTAIVVLFHKHRFIVMRRIFLMLALLYMMRAITMYITVLPVASKTYYCSPKANQTSVYLITTRVLHLISGFGLSVNGKHTYCGDYIYSGHTVILVLSYLIISEYSPKRFFPLHWLSWLIAIVGIIMVLLAHGHYSVDIVIAYYVTTRLFWSYHTLANNAQLKKFGPNNYIAREWWFPFFQYFEKNVTGPVPRQYDWPLPWPRRCHSKSRDS